MLPVQYPLRTKQQFITKMREGLYVATGA